MNRLRCRHNIFVKLIVMWITNRLYQGSKQIVGVSPYLLLLTLIYLTATLASLIFSPRLISIHIPIVNSEIDLPGGLFIFPFIYYTSDVLTEDYGFCVTRLVSWCVVASSIIFCGILMLIISEKPINYNVIINYLLVFGLIPRILASVLSSVFIGSFINDVILSKSKVIYDGKFFWLRSISATFIGEVFVGCVGTFLAWIGRMHSITHILIMAIATCIFNVFYQIILSPFITFFAKIISIKEKLNKFDDSVSYNPLSIAVIDGENSRSKLSMSKKTKLYYFASTVLFVLVIFETIISKVNFTIFDKMHDVNMLYAMINFILILAVIAGYTMMRHYFTEKEVRYAVIYIFILELVFVSYAQFIINFPSPDNWATVNRAYYETFNMLITFLIFSIFKYSVGIFIINKLEKLITVLNDRNIRISMLILLVSCFVYFTDWMLSAIVF